MSGSSLPKAFSGTRSSASNIHASSATSADVVAINAGGSAVGNFSADTDYVAPGTWAYTGNSAINTSGVVNPAPQSVYQTQRLGSVITYTIPGLTPGANYSVILSFVELYWSAAGKRIFNVAVNGEVVLPGFDIFAASGGQNCAITESIAAVATASGTITISFTATVNNAAVNAIEIAPTPNAAALTNGISIHAGGGAVGSFVADQDFNQNGTFPYLTTATVNVAGVTNPAPQAVYESNRSGKTLTYTIANLQPGTTYLVRLDFAELFWKATGQRIFNASINGTAFLTNFDIVAAAGGPLTAIAEYAHATASAAGAVTIKFTAVTDNATINGIELTPVPALNDYSTYGFDTRRDVFNPNSTALTPTSLANYHLAWQTSLDDYNTQTQPVLATEIPGHAAVLFVGGGKGHVYAYDALSGALIWMQSLGQEEYACENGYDAYFGVGGTVAYDPASQSVYVVGNANAGLGTLGTNTMYRLAGATGAILGRVAIATPNAAWPGLDFSHTAVTLANGMAYAGTSATCDISPWRGRIVAVNVPAMTVAGTFFPAWNGTTQPWGGDGIWGWGGVSVDAGGNVYTGVGQTDDGETEHGDLLPPFYKAPYEYSGLGDHFIKLSPNLSTLESSNLPFPTTIIAGNSADLDLNGTPALFQPAGTGCDTLAAEQGKSGGLYIYDTTAIGKGPIASYQLSPSTYADGFLGDPAYSPVTNLLYVGVPSSNESLFAPGMIAIDPGCGRPSVTWHTAFGPDSYEPGSILSPGLPRSVPAVSAGGVVVVGTICSASGDGCAPTTSSIQQRQLASQRLPQICCAPAGSVGGAIWALDASTGTVLNGGTPLLLTQGVMRMPATIDGWWMYIIDNAGHLYAFTLDPTYSANSAKSPASHR